MQNYPIAVIGGGPVGLAAAAHLLERNETPLVFEAGETVGANVREWGHVRMFSSWAYNVDAAAVRLLERTGWTIPPADQHPTGAELTNAYLTPLGNALADYIHTGARVVSVTRRNTDKMKNAGRESAPFVLHVEYRDGREQHYTARAVIDASGTWNQPNPVGSSGVPALGERRSADAITYGIPDVLGKDRARYADKRVMVVGSGHSAINTLLALVSLREEAPATKAYWVLRSTNMQQIYGGGEDDALPERGALGLRIQAAVESGAVEVLAPFRFQQVNRLNDVLHVTGETDADDAPQTVAVDAIIGATGSRPDLDMLRELRLDIDPATESSRTLAPMIDPNFHSCGTVPPHGEAELRHPENNFYIVGMKSYGRAPTFLLATGYEQVRSVVAALVGDVEAARDVQLSLPETGVCHTDFEGDGACCGGSAAAGVIQLDAISLNP